MADFESTQQALRSARDARDKASAALAAAQERLRRNDARAAELQRHANANDRASAVELVRLREEGAHEEAQAKRHAAARDSAIAAEGRFVAEFAQFTDPRHGIGRLNDQTPILMFPVRLETRFKGQELWVRIYPDDCLIDTFDPVLTKAEVTNAKEYWTSIWQAGGIKDQEDAAWIALASSHSAGRAGWIVDQFKPVNLPSKPTKSRPEDVILTLASDTPTSSAEQAAAGTYWRDLWLADGDASLAQAAYALLAVAIGEARAAELAQFPPSNFGAPLAGGVSKTDINVAAAFITWPPVDTRQSAWSQGPKARILPDRFVFLGYHTSQTPNDPNPVFALGNPVPSPLLVGPDPSAPKEQQLRHDEDGNLITPDELKWLSDFDRAVAVGMGLRIPLTPAQAASGFQRVLVLGVRLGADAQAGKMELESLLRAHANSRTGLAVVPQGTPTNNTEAVNSGASPREDPAESVGDHIQPLFESKPGWLDKADGQWLAEYLGVDSALFQHVHNAASTDQAAARAMNTALWPATLGYWMQTMMAPVFSDRAVDATRDFFTRYVVGSGACPAIRIGSQPYGILPATALSRLRWPGLLEQPRGLLRAPDALSSSLPVLYRVLLAIDQDFRALAGDVSFVGKEGDPHALLLDIVGLHPGSVEWSQRYAESLRTFFNRANLQGFAGDIQAIIASLERQKAATKLRNLGYTGERLPSIMELIFNGAHNALKGAVVEDGPLSETDHLRASTTDDRNYLQWLIDAAITSLDALYQQEGFKDNKVPTSLLFLFLRHALQLGYHDDSIRRYQSAGLFDAQRAALARQDSPFLHISAASPLSESRYQTLYAAAPAITGDPTRPVHEFIAAQLGTLGVASHLKEQVEALRHLKDESTARLERVFADHADCCAYRLDAWLLGLVTFQLGLMRNLTDGGTAPVRQGIYLGAYAWLEDLRPEVRQLTPARLSDPELIRVFGDRSEPPLMRDSANQGYIHAPSLNHAVTAAVLRNGFISNASPANRQTLAVNLTSERVRTAIAMIEGIRAGQSLSDLLGYQFERGLHDRHGVAEVDKYIFKLRKAFPLRADRFQSTKTQEGVPIEAIEARNVVNGLALVEHIKATGNKTYPFGKGGLPAITVPAEGDAINAEVDRLLESHDAVADLALSEGVYQAVLGNYDRVAATYDAYARGSFPPEPDVVRTPIGGIGLTHRVALHLPTGASHTVSPIAGLPVTPRAQGEPALNQWLASVFPALDQVACLVTFREAASGADQTREITLRQLDLQPIDLLTLIHDDTQQAMTELDDRVLRFAYLSFGPRPDVPLSIRYMEKQAAPITVFETMPLVRNLRTLTGKSRPLQPTDASLANEARSAQDSSPSINKARLDAVRSSLATLRADVALFGDVLDGPLSDLDNHRADVLANVDTWVTDLTAMLSRVALFGIPQAGWGFAFDVRQRTFAALLDQCRQLVDRWNAKLAECNLRLTDAATAASIDDKLRLLGEAYSAISSSVIVDDNPVTLEASVLAQRAAFDTKRSQFEAIRSTTRTSISLLRADVAALLPVSDFDLAPFTLTGIEGELVRFAQDASDLLGMLLKEIDHRLTLSSTLFTDHDSAAAVTDKTKALEAAARALLGEGFRIYPEFSFTPAQSGEFANAFAASTAGTLFQHLASLPEPIDFPVDTWLYGVARTREKMFAWEQVVMFSGALGVTEPELIPMQFPFAPGDGWFALELPPDIPLDTDRLLYTAHFTTAFDPTARQCGLLIDEWSETIPVSTVDTGIAFHHDRPNSEAPQAMLLVTPTEFRGAWQWHDLVDALNETLDLAKRRAVEPRHLDNSPYAPLLPATVMATQAAQLTIALDLAFNNKIASLVTQD